MPSRAIKFHEVHGSNIRLSADASEAQLLGFCHGICFTNRPMNTTEAIVLAIYPASGMIAPRERIRIGMTKDDPCQLRGMLPQYLRDVRDGDFWLLMGRLKQLFDCTGREFVRIDVSPILGLPIMSDVCGSKKFGTEEDKFDINDSYYLIFDLFVNTDKIKIEKTSSFNSTNQPLEVRPRSETKSRSFPNFILKEACFRSSFGTEVQVHRQVAISAETTVCDDNFVVVKTSLGLNSVLIVELTALKRSAPVRIILADEEFDLIQKRNRNRRLIGYSEAVTITGFFVIESETPAVGEELAIRISETGLVTVNHGDRDWSSRLTVDPALRYHVMFDMQNVSVLFLVGIATSEARVP